MKLCSAEKLCQVLLVQVVSFLAIFTSSSGQVPVQDFEGTDSRGTFVRSSSQQDAQNHTFKAPFILLMSSDTISVAQLPLIENGNISVVYRSANEDGKFAEPNEDDQREAEEDVDDIDNGVDGEDEIRTGETRIGDGEEIDVDEERRKSGADAREFEQMPTSAATSLGKSSEWQQIAGAGGTSQPRDREEVWPPLQPPPLTAATNRKEDASAPEEGEELRAAAAVAVAGQEQPRKKRAGGQERTKRSNSLTTLSRDDDGGDASSSPNTRAHINSSNNNGTVDLSAEENYATSDAQEERRVKESSTANVTSALFSTETGKSAPAAAAENQPRSGGAASYDEPFATGPPPAFPLPLVAENPSVSQSIGATPMPLQFCDFDSHMALGYVFVTDSRGRIHKFKLSTSPSQKHARNQLKPIKEATDSGNNNPLENDYANTPQTGSGASKFLESGGLGRYVAEERKPHDFASENRSSSNSLQSGAKAREFNSDSANVAKSGQSSGSKRANSEEVTHEQSGDHRRQHPTISGASTREQPTRLDAQSDAPISGVRRPELQRSESNVSIEHVRVHN